MDEEFLLILYANNQNVVMTPSFFALFSKAGIACAADADHTIYRLSKDLPVALAVNPASPIPWDSIIEAYKKKIDSTPRELFADYAFEFDVYLSTLEVDEKWKNLSLYNSNIMFLGYGSEDIFPSVYGVNVIIKEDGTLGLGESVVHQVSHADPAFFHMLGDFESVFTLLSGSTKKTRDFFYDKHITLWETYAERIREKFKGTEYEEYVTRHIDAYDYKGDIARRMEDATKKTLGDLAMGVDSFSVEDMVTAVESIVNANVKLNHLRSGAHGKPGDTSEIAVLTIPEGLSWIKHSIFLRRNEI